MIRVARMPNPFSNTLALSSEFDNYTLNTEFVAAVGMIRKKLNHYLKAKIILKLTVYSHFFQTKNQILT